jgi:hypothetical protein
MTTGDIAQKNVHSISMEQVNIFEQFFSAPAPLSLTRKNKIVTIYTFKAKLCLSGHLILQWKLLNDITDNVIVWLM